MESAAVPDRESTNGLDDNRSESGWSERDSLLDRVRTLYAQQGIQALSTPFLDKQKDALYPRLLAAGLKQAALLEVLGRTGEYALWRKTHRRYRGIVKPTWSWDEAVAQARKIVDRDGDLPTVQWCRSNGLSSLTSAVHNTGKTWEDLRLAVDLKPSANFCQSRNGMRWLSRPEACLSDFLHARGIAHRRGERYPDAYATQTGRAWGRYDMHFRTPDGRSIDVEVWGDDLNRMNGGRYRQTRNFKEAYQAGRDDFVGIPYKACLSDVALTEILKPFIGLIAPFVFEKPFDRAIETSHWSGADELLEDCRKLAASMPDGIFPVESWLRKRGKYNGRSGPAYNTLAIYVNRWLGGTRHVRKLLGQDSASTTSWTSDKLRLAWDSFVATHGVTPTQCRGNGGKRFGRAIRAEASKIDEAARRHGVQDKLQCKKSTRKIIWTPEHTLEQWRAFTVRNGRTPSQCMSKTRRLSLPRDVTDEASRIYDAARRLEILEQARGGEFPLGPAHQTGITNGASISAK
jgi:hypothetical protein